MCYARAVARAAQVRSRQTPEVWFCRVHNEQQALQQAGYAHSVASATQVQRPRYRVGYTLVTKTERQSGQCHPGPDLEAIFHLNEQHDLLFRLVL